MIYYTKMKIMTQTLHLSLKKGRPFKTCLSLNMLVSYYLLLFFASAFFVTSNIIGVAMKIDA